MRTKPNRAFRNKGFALIVTLSLMILLTVIAVGLLTLSSISLRTSSQGDAMAKARANARLALMLAIGDLQKMAGPDTRITAPANLTNSTAAPGVTGVWKSWRPPSTSPDYAAAKTGDNFLGYLMANPNPANPADPKTVPSGTKVQQLVGPGTVGTNNATSEIKAPNIDVFGTKAKSTGGLSWVTLDEGVKGRIDLPPAKAATSTGEKIILAGSPERNGFEDVKDMDFLVASSVADKTKLRDVVPKLISLDQSDLAASKDSAILPYFHDFSVDSASVQSDAANGGLKTDLSVLFNSASLPSDYSSRRLYSNTNAPLGGSSTAPDPLWALYQKYSSLYKKTTANDNPVDGLKAFVTPGYRMLPINNPAPAPSPRWEPSMATLKDPMIMPTVARVDIVFSLVTRDVHGARSADLRAKGYPFMLHMMYLPVITLHNPFNVPLRFTELEIEFADLPMGFQFLVNDQPATTSLMGFNQFYVSNEAGNNQKIFKMTLTGDLTAAKEVVMGPGETRIFGKPFPPAWKWSDEEAGAGRDGVMMFDWRNDKTGSSPRIMPGMITGPTDGVGYDVDWVAPRPYKSVWLNARTTEGLIPVKNGEYISVKYGPMSQVSSPTKKFSVTLRLKNGSVSTDIATSQIFFKDDGRLKSILEEGTSPRFKTVRSFPETYPKAGADTPKRTEDLYENNGTPVSGYAKARPFAIFSLSGKTTKESFTASRPVADTGATFQMATCDFTSSPSQGNSPLEFMLVPVRGGNLVMEFDGVKGYFFGGFGTNNGSTSAVYYEIPMAPLQSIAQLRHANAASLGSVPYVTYSVGESRAHPAIPADKSLYSISGKTYYDHSWLANDQLWDRYWFSTLASLEGKMFTGSSAVSMQNLATAFYDGTRSLPNMRNTALIPSGKKKSEAVTAVTTVDGKQSAAYMMTAGGFNVNSTSVAAWTSVLSGLCDTDVPLVTGADESVASGAPFLRTRRPVLGQSGGSPKEKLWSSYRTLKSAEIKTLAQKVVDEVRLRGPFLSMSEFVNRRLGAAADFTNKGALQAALDKSGFNSVAVTGPIADPIAPANVTGFGWDNPAAVTGSTGAGTPGEISQGDILSAIGSFTTVRSDTFKIRAYGDAKDGNGTVIARVWCEATVQRIPSYVDGADQPEALATTPANINFGRQFQVVSFRWLGPSEI